MARTKLLYVILVLCLVLGIVYLLSDYLRAEGGKNILIDQIDNTTQSLSLMEGPPENLQELLEQARADNQSARLFVSGDSLDVTQVINSLLNTAAERNLKVNPVSTEQWLKRNIGNGTYDMLPLELIVAGDQDDFVSFLSDLENRESFPCLAIEEMIITSSRRTGAGEYEEVTVDLSLSLVVRAAIVQ
ncbi:MAG: hypothetical protein JXA46_17320 [Dehalococcoidales bacterium]|nr:hypothetical protein [Dehalococcoidales bacterium]